MKYRAYPGSPYPLGATWDGLGVNFALFSEHAERVELCIFERSEGTPEVAQIPIRDQTDYVWHTYLPEARPGWLYGYRVYGPYDPLHGQRFNPHKLLIDPYAKALTGPIRWSDAMFGYQIAAGRDADLTFDTRDSAPGMPKAVVIEPTFTWGDDRAPRTPWHNTVIYEAHVKGFTVLHPHLDPSVRGTYSALMSPPVLEHLQRLGVTAIELMPVHHFVHDKRLLDMGLSNYWGYNTIGFFAPDPRYGATTGPGQQVNEFKTMVRTLHTAGIEVILDVVYNHTAEGNHLGPTLSFRGIDNRSYYRLADEGRFYNDYTGTGNTLNMLHPRTIQMIMDSLRYWVTEMHVDGFRFDLAATLARELHDVDKLSAFFDIIHQDPVLSQVKLIAEPWDIGEGGYQVGNFPVLWAEWNGKYRDSVRRFWRGDAGEVAELAYRLTGSSDLYAHNGRRPYASINFVTAHDGFTMHDLVSYNGKHNEANGDDNRDGHDDNVSWNHGAEGPTDEPGINELRRRQMRNFFTTLMVSQGVPMLLHGDEVMRTQQGNNNAYCQDNEISWQPWELTGDQTAMLEWVGRVLAFRRSAPVLRRRHFFSGRSIRGASQKDISWLRPDGEEMGDGEWSDGGIRSLQVWLAGAAADVVDDYGQPLTSDTLVILMNSDDEEVSFRLPPTRRGQRWEFVLDTSQPSKPEGGEMPKTEATYLLPARAMAIFRHRTGTR